MAYEGIGEYAGFGATTEINFGPTEGSTVYGTAPGTTGGKTPISGSASAVGQGAQVIKSIAKAITGGSSSTSMDLGPAALNPSAGIPMWAWVAGGVAVAGVTFLLLYKPRKRRVR
jgi:hypothetical protein